MRSLLFLVILSTSVLVSSCGNKKKRLVEVAAPKNSVSLEFTRLDTAMFSFQDNFDAFKRWHISQLNSVPFYSTFLEEVMGIRADSASAENFFDFVSHPDFKDLQKEINKSFGNMEDYQKQLNEAFQKISALKPGQPLPAVYFFNSGFNVGVFPDTTVLGIGLEWYLGPDHRIVKLLPGDLFPKYKKDNMRPEYLVSDAVKGWLLVTNFDNKNTENLLEYIVFYGKIMYSLDVVLPNVADSIKLNYSTDQMQWCQENEENVWKEMVKQDLVFSTKEKDLVKFTADGPFTSGFPNESPPQLGIYIGWQMVHDFMRKNSEVGYKQLMDTPAGEILKAYKPRN